MFETFKRRITIKLPWKIRIVFLGIALVRDNRKIQASYTNTNTEFRMKAKSEYGGDALAFELSTRVTDTTDTLTFGCPSAQLSKQPPAVRELFTLPGVAIVHLCGYRINVIKGGVFEWDELRPRIEEILIRHYASA